MTAGWKFGWTKALKKQREDKQEKRFKELRAYVRGDVGDDGEDGLVRTNIIHSNFAALLPQIYAKNPEIAVTPTEAAGNVVQWVPQFCKTMQAVLNRCFIILFHFLKSIPFRKTMRIVRDSIRL